MTDQSVGELDHDNTAFVLERDGSTAWYVIQEIDNMGVTADRYADGEPSDTETLSWNEFARMKLSGALRVYDLTDKEVSQLG